jgi:hypothetical protein
MDSRGIRGDSFLNYFYSMDKETFKTAQSIAVRIQWIEEAIDYLQILPVTIKLDGIEINRSNSLIAKITTLTVNELRAELKQLKDAFEKI